MTDRIASQPSPVQTAAFSYAQAAAASMAAQNPTPAAQGMGQDQVSRTAPAGQAPTAGVNLTGPAAPTAPAPAQPTEPELFLTETNQIVTADGQAYLGIEMYLRDDGQIVDPQGQPIDLSQIPGAAGAEAPPSEADLRTLRRIKVGTAVASGAMGIGMDYMWYRSTLGGMERRLASMQNTSAAVQAGRGLQGRLANAPVAGSIVRGLESRRQGKIETTSRAIQIARMTPAQEGLFLAKERLTSLRAESRAFKRGESFLGRNRETPVLGRIANSTETRRQETIKRLQGEIRRGEAGVSTWGKIRNATRGRIFPALMLASDGYSVYQGVKAWNSPGNERKWDDALRIGGNVVSAGADATALWRGSRGYLGGIIATHAAGIALNTVGTIFNDQD